LLHRANAGTHPDDWIVKAESGLIFEEDLRAQKGGINATGFVGMHGKISPPMPVRNLKEIIDAFFCFSLAP
jgi:hypothetical protein